MWRVVGHHSRMTLFGIQNAVPVSFTLPPQRLVHKTLKLGNRRGHACRWIAPEWRDYVPGHKIFRNLQFRRKNAADTVTVTHIPSGAVSFSYYGLNSKTAHLVSAKNRCKDRLFGGVENTGTSEPINLFSHGLPEGHGNVCKRFPDLDNEKLHARNGSRRNELRTFFFRKVASQ